jgi:aspartate racemase
MTGKGERNEMKTIGLIGGMSFESTITYYQVINEKIKEKLGGFHSAKVLLYSVDFQEIEECQSTGNWDKSAEILTHAAKNLETAGADFILICTNTMHKVAPQIQDQIKIPIIHIAEATSMALHKKNIKKALLLGTKYTMTEDFFKEKIIESGIEVMIPDRQEIELINHIIFDELCLGIQSEDSRNQLLTIIKVMRDRGAEGVILGCTEIGLLINQTNSVLPVFDTTLIHAEKAVLLALEN